MMTLVIRRPEDTSLAIPSGEVLLDGLEVLDATAAAADLPGISDYADAREIPEDFHGDGADLAELLGADEVWHDSTSAAAQLDQLADALGTGEGAGLGEAVRALAQVLREHPGQFQLDVLDSAD